MRHELIETICGAFFVLALLALEHLLPFKEPYNVLLACVIGAGAFLVLLTLLWRFRHSRMLRAFSDDLHHFVGTWLEEWHDGVTDRYSIACIRFEEKLKQYMLVGNSYDAAGRWKARWTSHHLFYDRGNCRLIYVSDGHEVEGKTVFGATCFHIDSHDATSGNGFFVDDSSGQLKHFDFSFRKLTDPTQRWTENPQDWIPLHHATRRVAGASVTA